MQKEIIEYQKTINELKEENARKTHNINELNNRIQQIISIKDLVINNLEKEYNRWLDDKKSKHTFIQKLQCTIFDQTIKIEELEEINRKLLKENTKLLLNKEFYKYHMDSKKSLSEQNVENLYC